MSLAGCTKYSNLALKSMKLISNKVLRKNIDVFWTYSEEQNLIVGYYGNFIRESEPYLQESSVDHYII